MPPKPKSRGVQLVSKAQGKQHVPGKLADNTPPPGMHNPPLGRLPPSHHPSHIHHLNVHSDHRKRAHTPCTCKPPSSTYQPPPMEYIQTPPSPSHADNPRPRAWPAQPWQHLLPQQHPPSPTQLYPIYHCARPCMWTTAHTRPRWCRPLPACLCYAACSRCNSNAQSQAPAMRIGGSGTTVCGGGAA